MARGNNTWVVEDSSDHELNDGEDVEGTGEGARRGGIDAANIVRRTFVFL